MKKRLVFHFFIAKDWRTNPIYKIHFNCLDYYKECFDEAYFALSLEDPNDIDSLYEVKQKLVDIFRALDKIEFERVPNTDFCECPTFKSQIAERIGKDDFVFFAHTKGVMNIKEFEKDKVYQWICGLYYFSLNEQKQDKGFLDRIFINNTHFISYGSFKLQFYLKHKTFNKYEWYYCGTFFWINSKRLSDYIRINETKLPEMSDRFYSENFLGNIYPLIENNPVFPGSYEIKGTDFQFLQYNKPVSIDAIPYYIEFLLRTEEEIKDYNSFFVKMTSVE